MAPVDYCLRMVLSIWSNTRTLHPFIPELRATSSPGTAEIAVVGASGFDVSSMPHLKAVFRCGVGTDNIDFQACEARGIRVFLPSPQSSALIHEETSNFAVRSILDGLYRWCGDVETWSKTERTALGGRTVLLLGQGNIGKRVRQKLSPLVTVQTWDPAADSFESLPGLLEAADVVSLHMPLDSTTRAWFGAERLALMRDGSCLVNTARGGIVDEEALLHEISSGRLRAIFDVFWEEPYFGPLRAFHPGSFVMTPHIASHCREFVESLAQDFRDVLEVMERQVQFESEPTSTDDTGSRN